MGVYENLLYARKTNPVEGKSLKFTVFYFCWRWSIEPEKMLKEQEHYVTNI